MTVRPRRTVWSGPALAAAAASGATAALSADSLLNTVPYRAATVNLYSVPLVRPVMRRATSVRRVGGLGDVDRVADADAVATSRWCRCRPGRGRRLTVGSVSLLNVTSTAPLTGAAATLVISGAGLVVSTMSKNFDPDRTDDVAAVDDDPRTVVSCRIWSDVGLTRDEGRALQRRRRAVDGVVDLGVEQAGDRVEVDAEVAVGAGDERQRTCRRRWAARGVVPSPSGRCASRGPDPR